MVDAKLVKYIQLSLSRNVPVDKIKSNLYSKGWKQQDVDEAIALATGRRIQPKTLPKSLSGPLVNRPVKNVPVIQQNKKEKPSKNLILIFAGIFVLIIVLFIVFLIIRNSSKISEEELLEGVSAEIEEGKSVRFSIGEEEHNLVVDSVLDDAVSITLQSNNFITTINLGETKKFDFEKDGVYDLSIKLEEVASGKSKLLLIRISEVCTEDWQCDKWSECENEEQTRVCEDLNECGTESNKPAELQACNVLVDCDSEGGSFCDDNEFCDGDLLNSTGGDCCVGECLKIKTISCNKDIDCFIDKAENCTLSNFTSIIDASNSTWLQNDSYYFRIRGFEGEKCEVYTEITDVSGKFSSSGRQSLIDAGINETEIDVLEGQVENGASNIVGDTGICRYAVVNLVEVLDIIKDEGTFELSEEDISKYECTGSLF